MRSFFMAPLCLALIHSSNAGVAHSFRDLVDRDPEPVPVPQRGFIHWISRLFKRVAQTSSTTNSTTPSTGGTCYEDNYYTFVGNLPPSFCQLFINTPNVTTTAEYTPTNVVVDVFTTYVSTDEVLSRVTPSSILTITVTPQASQAKRHAALDANARKAFQREVDNQFELFRRQDSTNITSNGAAAMSTSFSSACSCLDYPGSTVTQTYTNEPTTSTLSAFERTTTTVTSTTFDAARIVSTTTLTLSPTSSTASGALSSASGSNVQPSGSPTTSLSGEPTPTSPAFTCPDDNNTTVSQMVGNERFDYLILCDTVLMDSDFYSGPLTYSSFGQCASACSIADANFSQAVCQGVSYYATGSGTGNCFLKSTADQSTAADGVDTAILQRILIGVSQNDTAGSTTESVPFASPTMTQNSQQISSMMQSILSNSTNAMPIITPGPVVQSGMMVNAPGTGYSTFVSAGSTFSTGTVYSFSTHYSNGSWYYSYYSAYSEAWASSTTVYQASQNGYVPNNSTNSQVQQQSGDNGEYSTITNTTTTEYSPGWKNETIVVSNVTYAANGSQIASTATTYHYAYATGGAQSGGATALSGSGVSPASGSAFTSTSVQTVIINSGGTSGATNTQESGGPGATPTPMISATTIVNTYGTAYSTGFAASGAGSGIAGATSTAASGKPSVSTSELMVIVNSGGTGGVSSYVTSGGPSSSLSPVTIIVNTGGTSGASHFVTSGGPSALFTPISSTVNSGGTSGATTAAGSGGVNHTQGATSSQASGAPSSSAPSSTGPFNDTGAPRAPFYPSSTPSGTAPVATSTGPFNDTGAPRAPFFSSSSPSGTAPRVPSSYPFNNSGAPRAPFYPSSAPSGTWPTATSSYPFNNSGAPRAPFPYGSAPSGTWPTAPSSYPFNNSGAPRAPFLSGSSSRGTAPASISGPLPTGPSPYPSVNVTSPTGTAPLSSTSGSFSNSAPPRSGSTKPIVPSGTAPTRSSSHSHHTWPRPTGTSPPLATGPPAFIHPTTCSNATVGTTTVFSTLTVWGCFSDCPPDATGYGYPGGYGGGRNVLGLPVPKQK